MRVPRDQGLFFTVFFSMALSVILTAWLILPPIKQHAEEEGADEGHSKKVLTREQRILQTETQLTQAEEILNKLEQDKEKGKEQEKKKGKALRREAPKGSGDKTVTTQK